MKVHFGNKTMKVLFLRESDLQLMNSNKIQLKDLSLLPSFNDVSDEDCLDWLKYQRGMELQYCGFKSTTYTPAGDIKIQPFNRTSPVYKAKYDLTLKEDHSPKLGKFFYTCPLEGVMLVLNANNTVSNNMFTEVPGDLPSVIYRSLLDHVGYHNFYKRDCDDLLKTPSDKGHIDPGFVISKVVA